MKADISQASAKDILFVVLSAAFLVFSVYLRWNNHHRTQPGSKNTTSQVEQKEKAEATGKPSTSTKTDGKKLKQRRKKGGKK